MFTKTILGSLFLLVLPSVYIFSMGSMENKLNGNKDYKGGDFEGASVEYTEGLTKKADYDLYYNRGVSLYKLGQYDKSYSDFEDAATYANSEGDQIKAIYNAGNSNFMMAETVKTDNPGQSLGFYDKAVKHFERILELDSDNKDASYNLELSRLRMDEIEQQQKDDEQQSGDQKDGDKPDGDKQQNQQDGNQDQQANQQDENQNQQANQQDQSQQNGSENSQDSEKSYLSDEISPKDILNEEARRQEAMQLILSNGSGETVDKDW